MSAIHVGRVWRDGSAIQVGRVTRLHHGHQAGEIVDEKNRTWYFWAHECERGELPPIHSHVTFYRDGRYEHTRIAELIKIDTSDNEYVDFILQAIGE